MMEELLARIEELENWKKSFERSSTIPLDNFQALSSALSTGQVKFNGTGTFGTNPIVLSGSPPYSFDVPDQPSGTVKLIINGVEREFLVK